MIRLTERSNADETITPGSGIIGSPLQGRGEDSAGAVG